MKRLVFILFALTLCSGFYAQDNKDEQKLIDQANQMFEEGNYLEAHPIFSQLVSLHPKEADYNFKFGACSIFAGEDRQLAVKHLLFATSKPAVDVTAWYFLGKAHHLNYEFQLAIEAFETFLKKADSKIAANFDAKRSIEMCEFGNTLLSEIQDLVVLDKTQTSEKDFFRYFGLDGIGGKMLVVPEEIQTKLDQKKGHQGVMHFPSGATTIYFSSYGKTGNNGKDLYRASILPDGKYGDVQPLRGYINTPYDEDFAFMHPDGKTLYFASKGHNSMGGYDIFKSVYDVASDSFQPPQNLDFAINTPDDDLFYVADSLNKEAYFASARSSAQGNLHVYKVMVTGIPVVNIFIQGDFISEIDPSQSKARIRVTDELTGRPVADIESDAYSGQYLLTFPKPGLYKFEVEAENSPLIHEGIVEIPVFESSVALGQELRLIKEDGAEKLIIDNQFDRTLDVDIASLSREVLQAKAKLDVNVSEELLAQIEDQVYTIEKEISNAPMAAGYAEGVTVDEVIGEAEADVETMRQYVVDINERVDLAYVLAAKKHEDAEQKTSRAQYLMENADPENQSDYIEKLKEANKLIKQADRLNHEAQVAVMTAQASVEHASIKQDKANEIQSNLDLIKSSASSNDFDSAVTAMRWEKTRQMQNADSETPKTRALEEAKLKEDDEQRALAHVSSLRDDEKTAQTDINRLTRALENAKKKSDQNKFSAELEEAEVRLQIIGEDIKRKNVQAINIGEEEKFLLDQAAFYDLLINKDNSFGLTDVDIHTMGDSEKEMLTASLESTQLRIDVLRIDDAETLALIGEETKWTRNEIEKLASVQAKAVELGIESISAAQLETEHADLMLAVDSPDEGTNNYRKRILLMDAMETSDVQISMLKDVRRDLTDVAEIEIVDQEIENLEDLRSGWASEMDVMPQMVASVDPSLKPRDTYLLINPNYNSQLLAINNADLSEIEKSIQVLDVKRQTRMTLKDEMTENDAVIMVNDNTAEVAELIAENKRYEAAVESLNEEINDVNLVRAAYENENKSIIESDDAIVRKLEEQIQLTESYLAMLDQVRIATEREKEQTTDDDQMQLVIDMLEALNDEYLGAEQKLETYRNDLALTLATEDEPTASDNQPVALVEEGVEESSPAELRIIESVPEGPGEMITLIDPDYQAEWVEVPITYSSTEERSAAKVELNNNLIKAIDDQIQLRVEALDQETDESKKDQYQIDVQRLTSLRDLKMDEVANLSSDVVVDISSPATEEAEELSEVTFEDVADEELAEIFERQTAIDPKTAYESDLFESLQDENSDEEYAITNEGKIIDLRLEIAEMETQLEEDPDAKGARNLDRQIEKKYQKLADEEVDNARKIGALAEVRYAANQEEIEALEASEENKLNSSEALRAEYDHLLNKAQSEMDEAAGVRQIAGPEMDEIKQNYLYREAFTYEVNAISYQEKAMNLLNNIDALMAKEEAELAALIDGSWNDHAEELAEETSTEEPAIETSIPEDSTDQSAANTTEVVEDPVVEPVAENPAAEESAAVPVIELRTTRSVALAEIIDRRQLGVMASESHSIESGDLDQLLAKPEYVEYLSLTDDVSSLENDRANKIQERNTLAMETIALHDEIEKLDYAISQTDDDAERSGLEEERSRLRAQATVNYQRIEELDSEITGQEQELRDMMHEASAAFAALDFEEDIEELVEAEEAASPIAEETVPDSEPAERASSSSAPRDFANFVFPSVLEEEIFAILDSPVHSASNPIPVDVALPSGLVFKVQVGAFRNPIQQDHFDRFAPVSGELLQSGITRYTVGLFQGFPTADDAKSQVRDMGYSDAFVVAFFNGERIPLYEARRLAGEDIADNNSAAPTTSGSDSSNSTERSDSSEDNSTDGADVIESSTSSPASDNTSEGSSETSLPVIPDNSSVTEDDVAYYESYPDAAEANQIEVLSGLFFTVQIGVYSQPVSGQVLYNIDPLNSERLTNGQVRYSTGVYDSQVDASLRKSEIQGIGIADAFVTAYYNGQRISVREANEYLVKEGRQILDVTNELSEESITDEVRVEYDVFIGRFKDEVPAETAKAMLFLESTYGIQQAESAGETIYFTRKVSSKSEAEQMLNAFDSYEVTTMRIRAYQDGVEVPLNSEE